MAMKTGRAWLDVHNPTMADSALELAEEVTFNSIEIRKPCFQLINVALLYMN